MGEGLFQPLHLLVIFAIVLLLFGPQKLPQLGKGLGEAIRGFRDGLHAIGDKAIDSGASQNSPPVRSDEKLAATKAASVEQADGPQVDKPETGL